MNELEKLEADFKLLDEGITDLEQNLQALFAFKNIDAISENLSMLDKSKLNVSLAYSLNSLYFSKIFLRK
jgi:hypothetical protein